MGIRATNCISGLYHPQAGHIRFFDQAGRQHEITHLRPAQIARLGIALSLIHISEPTRPY